MTLAPKTARSMGERAGHERGVYPDCTPETALAKALELADDFGWHLFPLGENKKPLSGCLWKERASSDPDAIAATWKEWPGVRVGIATGPSGLVVLDIDRLRGDAGIARLRELFPGLPPAPIGGSVRNGRHGYFGRPGGVFIGNGANSVADGIDHRGIGGYICFHKWIVSPHDEEIPDLPAAIVERLTKRSTFGDTFGAEIPPGGNAPDALGQLDAECTVLAAMPKDSGRNDSLNRAAFRLGQLVSAGSLSKRLVVERLLGACGQNGLLAEDGQRACENTIASGLKEGSQRPRIKAEGSSGGGKTHDGDEERAEPIVTCLRDVKPEKVTWLWGGRLPIGKIALLEGPPGLGKSTAALDIAARVSTGAPMPGATERREPAAALIASVEDGEADTIVPRLRAADADLSRCHSFRYRDRLPTLPDDIGDIERVIRAYHVRLLVLDPLMALLGSETNSYRDQDVRRALGPLAQMADETGCAVLVIRHLNKAQGGPAIYRGGGSIGIAGAARSVLVVGADQDDEALRHLAVTKSNLAARADTLTYRLECAGHRLADIDVARVNWTGTSELTADQLVNQSAATDEEQGELADAMRWLEGELADEERESTEITRAAKAAGIRVRTLERARRKLGVDTRRKGFGADGKWYLLPIGRQSPDDGGLWGEGAPSHPQPSEIASNPVTTIDRQSIGRQPDLAAYGGADNARNTGARSAASDEPQGDDLTTDEGHREWEF